ncbi:LexA family protein [Streptomyces sp. NPDC002917]|uniref:LexA family protein n=1 Tax=Streptomyces sp. NPDC002917 TaxID=3364671 RepID=UPI0036AA1393
MRALTETQERILAFIRQTITETGVAPPVRQITAGAGLRSRATVHYQLGQLKAAGRLRHEPGRHRSIRLT